MTAVLDPHSATWQAVKVHVADRLASARAVLETEGLDPVQTENARGRIAELRILLALADPKPLIVQGPADYL